MKIIHVKVDDNLHKAARVLAAEQGKTLTEVVVEALEKATEKEKSN